MIDRIFWEYLEEMPEQEAAWHEWQQRLIGWHRFNTFYTHYLSVDGSRARLLKCTTPCEHVCLRQVIEYSPSNITAICPRGEAAPIQLKFRDILIYSLRREIFHQALCTSLQIEYPSGNRWPEFGSTWYLGDYFKTALYFSYQGLTLTDAIISLCWLHKKPFVIIAPTGNGLTSEAKRLLTQNNSVLLLLESELSMQADGSFKPRRSIAECLKI